MSGDYKWDIQMIFEEMCAEVPGCDNYWDLSDAQQQELYEKATREYSARMADRADYLRKAERENPR
jgi:hypothetical protein